MATLASRFCSIPKPLPLPSSSSSSLLQLGATVESSRHAGHAPHRYQPVFSNTGAITSLVNTLVVHNILRRHLKATLHFNPCVQSPPEVQLLDTFMPNKVKSLPPCYSISMPNGKASTPSVLFLTIITAISE